MEKHANFDIKISMNDYLFINLKNIRAAICYHYLEVKRGTTKPYNQDKSSNNNNCSNYIILFLLNQTK